MVRVGLSQYSYSLVKVVVAGNRGILPSMYWRGLISGPPASTPVIALHGSRDSNRFASAIQTSPPCSIHCLRHRHKPPAIGSSPNLRVRRRQVLPAFTHATCFDTIFVSTNRFRATEAACLFQSTTTAAHSLACAAQLDASHHTILTIPETTKPPSNATIQTIGRSYQLN